MVAAAGHCCLRQGETCKAGLCMHGSIGRRKDLSSGHGLLGNVSKMAGPHGCGLLGECTRLLAFLSGL